MCFLLAAEAGTAGHGFGAHLQGGLATVLAGFAMAGIFRRFGAVRAPALK